MRGKPLSASGANTMSDHLGPSATLIPAQPAVLVVGERHIPVEEWSLAVAVDEYRSVEVEPPDPERLVIGPRRRSAGRAIAQTVLVVLGGALPGVFAVVLEVPWWGSALLVVGALAGLLLLVRAHLSGQRWVRFDRATGRLEIEQRVGFRRDRRVVWACPLESVRAVQLLFNGRHSVTEPQGAGEQQTTSYRQFCGYELNLVLDDPATPRRHLFSMTDWQWVRQTGQSIGEFLGVPVMDGLYHGG